MPSNQHLIQVYKNANEILFDDTSRFIFFSDCHRGDGSESDDFAINKAIYMEALHYYHQHGFTYVEIGDGDELWENRSFSRILKVHADVFLQLRKFNREGRLYMISGNHDIVKRRRSFVEKNLYQYFNDNTQRYEPLLEGIQIRDGLILKHKDTSGKIFVVHGHQDDLLNDRLWPLARFLVRYVWRRLEILGIQDPISPAKNYYRKEKVEENILGWVRSTHQMTIAGHTHRASYPASGSPPYFNTGCCVHPDSVTGVEIQDGLVQLVRWSRIFNIRSRPGIIREVVAGPEKLARFL